MIKLPRFFFTFFFLMILLSVFGNKIVGPVMAADPAFTTPEVILEGNQIDAQFGLGSLGSGDFNNDGYVDVAVGSYYYDNTLVNDGAALVYYGTSTGIPTDPSWITYGPNNGIAYGYSMAVGDFNNDSYDDLAVGAYLYTVDQSSEGAVFIYYGSGSGLSDTYDVILDMDVASSKFGYSLSSAGDVNNDGYEDLLVGSIWYPIGGAVFLYYGSADGLSGTPFGIFATETSTNYATSIAGGLDINGDNYDDIIVGAKSYASSLGAFIVYYGSVDGPITNSGYIIGRDLNWGGLGYKVASAGDVNNDGYDDVLVTAPSLSVGATNNGEVYLYLGTASGISTSYVWSFSVAQDAMNLGRYALSGVGDTNGDGYDDILIGSDMYDGTVAYSGKAWLFKGNSSGVLSSTPNWSVEGTSSYLLGTSSIGAGDIDNDGFDDFMIGASNYVNGESGEGGVFIYYGDGILIPSVSLSTSASTISENLENSIVTATLSLAAASDVVVTLGYAGTATNTTDYTRSAGTITILAGELIGTATITAVQDTLYEGDETVITTIESITGANENGEQSETITITEDDSLPSVTLSASNSSIDENGGTSTVTATLSNLSVLDTTVNLSYSGTATNTSDYTRSSSTITISAGESSGSVTLTGVDDSLIDVDETIIVDIDSLTNGSENGTQTETVTINDDEVVPTVTIAVDDNSILETGGVSVLTATLSNTTSEDVVLGFTYSGTATNTSDYTRSSSTITISAGDLTGVLTVSAVGDTLDETNETVIVDLDSVSNAIESVEQTVTITINDDDNKPLVTLSSNVTEAVENLGSVILSAILDAASSFDVVVNLLSGGVATLGTDYVLSSDSITISAGDTSGTATLTMQDDSIYESNELFNIYISDITNGIEDGDQSVDLSITDDDSKPFVTLSRNNASVDEGGSSTITATLSNISYQDVTVTLTLSGTATKNSDYSINHETITINAGRTTGTAVISSTDDSSEESDETILAEISSVLNGTEDGDQSVLITIVDNDEPEEESTSSDEDNDSSSSEDTNSDTTSTTVSTPVTPASGGTIILNKVSNLEPDDIGNEAESDENDKSKEDERVKNDEEYSNPITLEIGGVVIPTSDIFKNSEDLPFEDNSIDPVNESDGIEIVASFNSDSGKVTIQNKMKTSTLNLSEPTSVDILVPVNETNEIASVIMEVEGETIKGKLVDGKNYSLTLNLPKVLGAGTVTAKININYVDGKTVVKGMHFVLNGVQEQSFLSRYSWYLFLLIIVVATVYYINRKQFYYHLTP